MLRAMALFVVAAVIIVAVQAVEPGHGDIKPEYWHRPHWPWSPPPPPAPSPPAPVDPWFCDRPYAPEELSDAEENEDCPPPPPPASPPQNCGWPCLCPWKPPRSRPASATSGCLAAFSAVKNCGPFITGEEDRTPSIGSRCCTGIRTVLNFTTTATADDTAAAGGGDALLHKCICPLILGDVAGVLPKPADLLRLTYLPVACGFAIPPQLLYLCYSGKASAPVVGSFKNLGD